MISFSGLWSTADIICAKTLQIAASELWCHMLSVSYVCSFSPVIIITEEWILDKMHANEYGEKQQDNKTADDYMNFYSSQAGLILSLNSNPVHFNKLILVEPW